MAKIKLTKENSPVFKSEKGNLFMYHPEFKTELQLYKVDIEDLVEGWRDRVKVNPSDYGAGHYCVLVSAPLEKVDV